MNSSIRDKIRIALKGNSLTVAEIGAMTNIDNNTVATALSAMKIRTNEVRYTKDINDSYGKYSLLKEKKLISITNIQLKISQLKINKEILRAKGLSLVDDIINDYILILQNS